LRFFLDNCLSPRHAKALNSLSPPEYPVSHLSDVFAKRNTRDEEWLPALSIQGGWVVVSGDTRIFKSPHLKQIWLESKLTAFFLAKGWMNQQFWDQAWWLVRWWPQVIEQARLMESGTGFEIPAKSHGKFRLLNPSPSGSA